MFFQLRLRDNLCRVCRCYHEPDAPPPPKPPPPPPKPPPKPPRPLPPRPTPEAKAYKSSCASEVINTKNTPIPIIKLAIKPMPLTRPAAVPATAAEIGRASCRDRVNMEAFQYAFPDTRLEGHLIL